jgi:hypothetical protein
VSFVRWVQTAARLAALIAALLIGADDADVCLANGLSFGTAGAGAAMLLASAATAETAITGRAPATVQGGPQTYPGGSLSDLFQSGGWLGSFAAGFLGSGLLGLLFGRGLVGELGSVASYFGLIIQLALLLLLCRLIWTRWRGGDPASFAARSPRQLADPYLRSRDDLHGGRDPSLDVDAMAEPETTRSSPRSSRVSRPGGERK